MSSNVTHGSSASNKHRLAHILNHRPPSSPTIDDRPLSPEPHRGSNSLSPARIVDSVDGSKVDGQSVEAQGGAGLSPPPSRDATPNMAPTTLTTPEVMDRSLVSADPPSEDALPPPDSPALQGQADTPGPAEHGIMVGSWSCSKCSNQHRVHAFLYGADEMMHCKPIAREHCGPKRRASWVDIVRLGYWAAFKTREEGRIYLQLLHHLPESLQKRPKVETLVVEVVVDLREQEKRPKPVCIGHYTKPDTSSGRHLVEAELSENFVLELFYTEVDPQGRRVGPRKHERKMNSPSFNDIVLRPEYEGWTRIEVSRNFRKKLLESCIKEMVSRELGGGGSNVQPGSTGHADFQPGSTEHADFQPGSTEHADVQPGSTEHADVQPGSTEHADVQLGSTEHADESIVVRPGKSTNSRSVASQQSTQSEPRKPSLRKRSSFAAGLIDDEHGGRTLAKRSKVVTFRVPKGASQLSAPAQPSEITERRAPSNSGNPQPPAISPLTSAAPPSPASSEVTVSELFFNKIRYNKRKGGMFENHFASAGRGVYVPGFGDFCEYRVLCRPEK